MKFSTKMFFIFVFTAPVHRLYAGENPGNPSSVTMAGTLTGAISGRVINARTQEALIGVNIVVMEYPRLGSVSDSDGRFVIKDVNVGVYRIRFSSIGFTTFVLTNVVVATGRQSPVHVAMDEKVLPGENVTVKSSYFSKSQMMSPVSSNTMDRAEIRRAPGAIQDVQRVVQALPGVASSTDNINELIVRGGVPFENLTVMDQMEIPSINHYSDEDNSAGPINMVNADMIQDMQFSAGGFPVVYGDKASSVMNLTVREGTRNKAFSSNSGFNMVGLGTLMEGRLAGGRGSYIFSARKSLLEVVDKIVGMSSISLTSVPRYWDTQAKIVYDLSERQKLSFNLLYGESRITIEGDMKEADAKRKNSVDSSSVDQAYPFDKQHVAGLNLRSLWGRYGFSNLTLYTVGSHYQLDEYSDFARRVRGAEGEVLESQVLSRQTIFRSKNLESFLALKYTMCYQPHPRHEWSVGGQIQTTQNWENRLYIHSDTVRYDLDRNGSYETGPVIIPTGSFQRKMKFGEASRYYLYFSEKFKMTQKLDLTVGCRYDGFTYAGNGVFSPRASLNYQLYPATTSFTLAVGRYPQTHPLPCYGDRNMTDQNRHLQPMYADHFVAGVEHILGDGLKLNVEAYYKNYERIAVEEDFVFSNIDTLWSEKMLTIGKRRTFGVEFFLEQKQVKDFYGTLSLSLGKSRDADPRVPKLVNRYPSAFDYPVIVTAVGGRLVHGLRDKINAMPFFIKYPARILPLSNDMEIGFKYRYQSGRPYTPEEFVAWKQYREGGVKWSKGAWVESDRINSKRYPDYQRLDFQWISRFYAMNLNLNVYIAIQNLLDTKNVFYEASNSDGTHETVYQFRFFPVGGIEIEF